MNSSSVFQGESARTTSTVGSAVKRAMGLSWSIVYCGLRPRILSASGRIEIDDRLISSV